MRKTETNDVPLAGHLARLLERLSAKPYSQLARRVDELVRANLDGHVCVQVDSTERPALLGTGVVGTPGEFRPLVLDAADRLYLHRLWSQEKIVGDAILRRLQASPPSLDEGRLQEGLVEHFGKDEGGVDRQRIAAEMAVRGRFTMISGGPGTGKTRTVLGILSLLVGQTPGKPPRLALAAPTGKAAARLRESVQAAATSMEVPEAQTIHRLLAHHRFGQRRIDQAPEFLPLDGIIVDEASMVDLGLLARLFKAMPPLARIILLGDRHQLASVEAGAAFGDLCRATEGSALAGHVVELRKSYRFSEESGIYQISRAVQAGDADQILGLLRARTFPDIEGVEYARAAELADIMAQEVVPSFMEVLSAPNAVSALARLEDCRVLCALRKGVFGVVGLNALIQRLLEEKGGLEPVGEWFAGRPVTITQNDYEQRLFNGETGLCLPDPEADDALRIYFPGETAGTVRRFIPANLPPHETAFAMTIHRSQGSEFNRVVIVLPPNDAAVLSRELLYTAITRARTRATLCYQPEILRVTVSRQVRRLSGLLDRISE